MNFRVIWSPSAKDEFAAVLEYLDVAFGTEAALALLDRTENVIDHLCKYPFMYTESTQKGIRKAVVSKQTSIIYRLKEDTIEILHVWDNRQNPEKFEG